MQGNEPLVLVIDHEPGIRKVIQSELIDAGFNVRTAGSGHEGIVEAEKQRPDLIILDMVMPDLSGLEVLREVRTRSNVPVIMLSDFRRGADAVLSLESGADDCMSKPVNLTELGARVRAVLRRSSPPIVADGMVYVGRIEIDLARRLVRDEGAIVSLTRTEWNLLRCLAENADRLMLNNELLGRVWGPEYVNDLQYLRVWICRLRAKLDRNADEASIVRTFPGIGYMLSAFAAPAGPDPEAVLAMAEALVSVA